MLSIQNGISAFLAVTATKVLWYSADALDVINNSLGLLVLNELDNYLALDFFDLYYPLRKDKNNMRINTSPIILNLRLIPMLLTMFLISVTFILTMIPNSNAEDLFVNLMYSSYEDSKRLSSSVLVLIQMYILALTGFLIAAYILHKKLK